MRAWPSDCRVDSTEVGRIGVLGAEAPRRHPVSIATGGKHGSSELGAVELLDRARDVRVGAQLDDGDQSGRVGLWRVLDQDAPNVRRRKDRGKEPPHFALDGVLRGADHPLELWHPANSNPLVRLRDINFPVADLQLRLAKVLEARGVAELADE